MLQMGTLLRCSRKGDGDFQIDAISRSLRSESSAKQHVVINNGISDGKVGEEEAEKCSMSRRSARIQWKERAEKERLVKRRVELLDEKEGVVSRKRQVRGRRSENEESVPDVAEEDKVGDFLDCCQVLEPKDNLQPQGGSLEESNGLYIDLFNVDNATDKSAHFKVKDTLRLFNKHYLHLVQEEEMRCKKEEVNHKATKASKLKKGKAINGEIKTKAKRPDLKAISKMMETNAIMYPEKRIGNLPGINVGHQFYSRAEMVAVGFHSHWLNGIDYMGKLYKKGEYSDYVFPLAVAIVLSGMYEDDLDNADDVVYTGQGGHNLAGNKRQIRDQVLERGNLALKNCIDQCVPIRVVRGHESSSSYCGKVYTYDGLYKVVQYWAEKGLSGYTVFKFRLSRLGGQSVLTTNQVHFVYGQVPQSFSEIRGLVCKDISDGQESIPIPATNLVDEPPTSPSGYTYCMSIQVAKNVKIPSNSPGCNCNGSCVDPRNCACAKLNGSDFPYVHRNGGRLIEAKDVVFECGPNCTCGPACINRTSQKGLKFRLEVFRTPKKGWAVRSWDFIPSGAPVCEYTGILTRTEDLDNVSENSYIFDIDCLQTMKGLDGRERRLGDVSMPIIELDKADDQKSEVAPEFCIDAGSTGNVARFINHSCEPNLFVQCVLTSHHDIKLARVMLFAADNIPPLQELSYDYGYALDSVHGPDGKIKQMPCYCGAQDCRKRLF